MSCCQIGHPREEQDRNEVFALLPQQSAEKEAQKQSSSESTTLLGEAALSVIKLD